MTFPDGCYNDIRDDEDFDRHFDDEDEYERRPKAVNDMEEFQAWSANFSLRDDGIAAFKSLKKLEKARFILATREMIGDGWIEELEQALA